MTFQKNDDRQALLAQAAQRIRELRSRVEELEDAGPTSIAIVGMACRLPGADNPESLWSLLLKGGRAISSVPPDRFDISAFYDADPDAPGKTYVQRAGFLDSAGDFDAAFFNLTPREAASTDPQHRLLLELVWEALENAAIAPSRLPRARTGIYVGISHSDYALLESEPAHIDAYTVLGASLSFAAGRLAYALGLQGPAVALDTACSSSLVAVHAACQSLRTRETEVAIVGGVNLLLSPIPFIGLSRARMLAPDGRSKPFDASADGYGRGEGAVVFVLKRLDRALGDADPIHAVILASVVNQDGRSSGLTVPNPQAQQMLVRDALRAGRLAAADVAYVEAHGTGTVLGDPIEVRALAAALGEGRMPERPLLLGSIKTNIGHLEAAAGVAGLLKAVLMVQHRTIPPQPYDRLNPHIEWDHLPVRVQREGAGWPTPERAIAGVSAFGVSGTNAHTIVAAFEPSANPSAEKNYYADRTPLARSHESAADKGPAATRELVVLSAKSAPALREMAACYASALQGESPASLRDVAYTAALGREPMEHRLALLAESPLAAARRLAAWSDSGDERGIALGRVRGDRRPAIAFLFTGQGAHYPAAGRVLLERSCVFRDALAECDAVLRSPLGRSLVSMLQASSDDAALLQRTRYAQPVLFALQYALARLWQSWGIVPTVVLGHSLGEYAAACVAGVFSLADALHLITERSRLIEELDEPGAMAAVFAGEELVLQVIESIDGVSIAALNNPLETVISGPVAGIDAVLAELERQSVRTRRLNVAYAFHSRLVDPILPRFESIVARVALAEPKIKLVSSLSGQMAPLGLLTKSSYWRRQVRAPVRFSAAIQATYACGAELFVEIGPAPTLLAMARRCLPEGSGSFVPSLRDGADDLNQMSESLGRLYVEGCEIAWAPFFADRGEARRVRLPSYPFQRRRHWRANGQAMTSSMVAASAEPALLEGVRLDSASIEGAAYTSRILSDDLPGFREHRILGAVVLAGAYHIAFVRRVLEREFPRADFELAGMNFENFARLTPGVAKLLELKLSPERFGIVSFSLFGRDESESVWTTHLVGRAVRLVPGQAVDSPARLDTDAIQRRCATQRTGAEFYSRFFREGEYEVGPTFHHITSIWIGDREVLAELRLPADRNSDPRETPLLREASAQEASAHITVAALPRAWEAGSTQPLVGKTIGRARMFAGGPARWVHAIVQPIGDSHEADIRVFDSQGATLSIVSGYCYRRIARAAVQRAMGRGRFLPRRTRLGDLPADRAGRAAALRRYLVGIVAELSGLLDADVDVDTPLRSIGIDSLLATELRAALEQELGCSIHLPELLEGPAVAQLAASLLERLDRSTLGRPESAANRPALRVPSSSASWVLRIASREHAALRLFCLPYGGAGASVFRRWPALLPDSVEVCAVQPPGREERAGEPAIIEMQSYLDTLTLAIEPYLDRPFAFYGCSLGALVAFELARQLRCLRRPLPQRLFLAAAAAPHLMSRVFRGSLEEMEHQIPEAVQAAPELLEAVRPLLEADLCLARSLEFTPADPLACEATVFGGTADPLVKRAEIEAWSTHFDGTFVRRWIQGGHLFMDTSPELVTRLVTRDLGFAEQMADGDPDLRYESTRFSQRDLK